MFLLGAEEQLTMPAPLFSRNTAHMPWLQGALLDSDSIVYAQFLHNPTFG